QNNFNQYLSKIRVRVEHAFAALKGHFQSLRELRHPVGNEKELQYVIHWVNCCLILHNMIIQFEER
ncbi:hypothetical protein PAXRUDRAFT_174560, partial [Paxillus rubicundulus Ve08.2h10]